MYEKWTREDIKQSQERFRHIYQKAPVDYRFFCGRYIQGEDDTDALDYYMIGAWLVLYRKYRDWSRTKSFDLAEIPRYMRRTKFYRKRKKELLEYLDGSRRCRDNDEDSSC